MVDRDRHIKHLCCNLSVLEGYYNYVQQLRLVSRLEQGNAYLFKICRTHNRLPAEAAYEFARILRQL